MKKMSIVSLEPSDYLRVLISEAQTRGIKRIKVGDFEIEFHDRVSFEVVEPPSQTEINENRLVGGPLNLGQYDEDDDFTPDTVMFPGAVRRAEVSE